MSAKPLPPTRPPGAIDLLDSSEDHPSDPDWRADALGPSRHSRLADEMRAPQTNVDPVRAEEVCAQITRETLRDYAPALMLLSGERRRRAQALTAWAATLFDLALRPGLAGLDGDRLAQINAWEFQTEEALDGGGPSQPVFVMLARENDAAPWPRDALDRVVAAARRAAVGQASFKTEAATGILVALLARRGALPRPDLEGLTRLFEAALDDDPPGPPSTRLSTTGAPPGWRRAASYVKRVQLLKSAGKSIGLTRRLTLLTKSLVLPR